MNSRIPISNTIYTVLCYNVDGNLMKMKLDDNFITNLDWSKILNKHIITSEINDN